MLFQPFPSLPRAEARAIAGPIDLAAVRIAPADALMRAGGAADGLRLVQRANAPAYLVETRATTLAIDATTGRRLPLLRPEQARSIVARSAPGVAVRVVGPYDYDQWIVHHRFDPVRPAYRVDLADAVGTTIYLSARTGEPIQRTTRSARGWNMVGAVLHWIYLTPLRADWAAWDRTVWWISLVALVTAVAGATLGIVRTRAAGRSLRRGWTPYRTGWLRWHHLGGLGVGAFAVTWVFSGWLSMDHGRLFSTGRPSAAATRAFAGLPLRQAAEAFRLETLHAATGVAELQFQAIAGEPVAASWRPDGSALLLTAHGAPLSRDAADRLIARGVAAAWPGQVREGEPVLTADLYAQAEGWPATVRAYRSGKARLTVYADVDTGEILTAMDASRARYAWLYYGLHTFKVPALIERPGWRRTIVLTLLGAGFLFSVTGVVLAVRRLRRTSARGRSSVGVWQPSTPVVS